MFPPSKGVAAGACPNLRGRVSITKVRCLSARLRGHPPLSLRSDACWAAAAGGPTVMLHLALLLPLSPLGAVAWLKFGGEPACDLQKLDAEARINSTCCIESPCTASKAEVEALRDEVAELKAQLAQVVNHVFSPPLQPPMSPPPPPPPPDAAWLRANGAMGTPVTYSCTGSAQSVQVPSDVHMYYVQLWGAAGGGSDAEGYQWEGGCGGTTVGYMTVVAGSTLQLEVGCGGQKSCSAVARPYPYGGLPSYRTNYCAGQGGGRSAIKDHLSTYHLVAGGGGGSGGKGCGDTSCSTAGGNGGGLVGTYGLHSCGICATGGSPGNVDGSSGSFYHLKGQDACQVVDTCNSIGGGGDGWYGGRTAGAHTGGGGGSGYLHNGVIDGSTSAASVKCGVAGDAGANGEIRLTPIK